MKFPFPGMDPYLEQPMLWESVHARLIPELANQLQPKLDPRYIATIEERVFIEGPQRRIPDVWIQKTPYESAPAAPMSQPSGDKAVILEVDDLEIHQKRIEIVDAYNEMKLVAVIEVISPTNKYAGPGREAYLAKQHQLRDGDCHLIEIDLLRHGPHVLSVPEWRIAELKPFDYLICVSRFPYRNRFELYPRRLRQRLPVLNIPLADGDADIALDVQAALEKIYWDGRYFLRVRYDQPCEPRLDDGDATWAREQWRQFQNNHPEYFPNPQTTNGDQET